MSKIATVKFAGELYIRKSDIVEILLIGARNWEDLTIPIPANVMLRALAQKVGELK